VETFMHVESAKVILAHMEANPAFDGAWGSSDGDILTTLGAYFMGRLGPRLLEHWEKRKKKKMPQALPFPLQVAVFLHSIGEDWMPPMVVADYTNPRFDLVNRTIEVLLRGKP